jgi:hypothetical protein
LDNIKPKRKGGFLKAVISFLGKKHQLDFNNVIELHVAIQGYVKRDWDLQYNDGDEVAMIVRHKGPSLLIIGSVRLLDGHFKIRGYLEDTVEKII